MNKFMETFCLVMAALSLWVDHQMGVYFAVMAIYFKE